MELLLEFLFEFFLELLLDFADTLVKENQQLTKRQKTWLRFLSVTLTVAMVSCLLFGIVVLCEEGYTPLGITLTAIGSGLLLVQIIISVITSCRRRRRATRAKTATPNNGASVK